MSQANDDFAAKLASLGVPAPWELHDEELGVILAANKAGVLTVDTGTSPYPDIETTIALAVILAVNTCAGFKATIVEDS
jgi:hypothetical protein